MIAKTHRNHQFGFSVFVQLKMIFHVNARIYADTSVKELSLTFGLLYVYLNSNVLFFFSLNLSRDWIIGFSCHGSQSVHDLMTKWVPFATSDLRSWIFQQVRQSTRRCKKCPATFLGHDNLDLSHSISLHFNQPLQKLVVVEGCDFVPGIS